MAAGDDSVLSLEHTPTWAVAVVCLFFISISLIIEHSFHLISNWLKRNRRTALHGAVEKLKSELMLLGFISLLLAVTQSYIAKICISADVADTMLPCPKRDEASSQTAKLQNFEHFSNQIAANLSSAKGFYGDVLRKSSRLLAEVEEEETIDSCTAKGKVALVTEDAIHQLHIFIFVLAAMQIVYSTLTMALGRAKMRRWKAWEKETQTTEYLVANDPNRFRFTRQTTFGRRHMNTCTETTILLWIKCFYRQFSNSVAKVDYLTLRHGFITAHLSQRHSNFNFQKYIKRTLDEDFSIMVGISPIMWFLVVILLLVDVYGWHVYTGLSYFPMLIVLIVGTKLEVIVARMALQIKEQNNVIIGTPLVKPNDNLFWFGKPDFVLTLLHYALFVNAFELAFFIWVTIQFGLNSCYHIHTGIIISRVVLAVTAQVICSYFTLPLYALVLEEQISTIIKQWLVEVRERRKKQEYLLSARTSFSTEWSPRLSGATIEALPLARHGEISQFSNRGENEIMEEEKEKRERATLEGPSFRDFI
ncbi:hypothetical protein UlMin_005878 [Ulmus minor]